jgi:hypothetical protein
MPKSVRHQNAARKAAAKPPEKTAYRIADPHHTPDMKGEFAGAKVRRSGEHQVVHLTPAQAKFYLDNGALEKLQS